MAAFHCCVPLCTNDSRYDKENKLSFHRFPSDKRLRKEWLTKIRRDIGRTLQLSNASRVCSAHFQTSDISRSLCGKRNLKPDTVPSIFSWSEQRAGRKLPQRRTLGTGEAGGQDLTVYRENESPADITTTPASSSDHDYNETTVSSEDKLEAAHAEIERLNNKLLEVQQRVLFLDRFCADARTINFYTGFKDYQTLKCLFVSLQPTAVNMIRWTQMQRHASDTNNIKLCSLKEDSLALIDQFFMFLCRVRQGLPEQDLAVRFGMSQASVSRIIITWANYLYIMFGSLNIWPSRFLIDKHMPLCFKNTYPFTRVVIDCTEVKVQTPSSKVLNSEVYSTYKSHTTFKGLIGITPCGVVSFVSSLYTGCISDKDITVRSGLLDLIEPHDQVLADKGFTIQDLLEPRQAQLVIPPFLADKGKFSESEVKKTHEIARLRIHVERAIRRVKEYHIFDGVIPLNLAASINQIWTVCSILTNFRAKLF